MSGEGGIWPDNSQLLTTIHHEAKTTPLRGGEREPHGITNSFDPTYVCITFISAPICGSNMTLDKCGNLAIRNDK